MSDEKTWFKTSSRSGNCIETVAVVSDTARYVNVKIPHFTGDGFYIRRESKASDWNHFFPSFEEAKTFVTDRLAKEVEALERKLEMTRELYKAALVLEAQR